MCVSLSRHAPVLETLNISALFSVPWRTLPTDIFAGIASNLRTCSIGGVNLPAQICPAFSHVTTFTYRPCHPPGTLTAGNLTAIFRNMPCLTTLILDVRAFSALNDEDQGEEFPPRAVSTLRCVRLVRMCSGFSSFFRLLPRLDVGQLNIPRQKGINWWEPFLAEFPTVSSISLGLTSCEARACPADANRPLRLVFGSPPHRLVEELMPSLLLLPELSGTLNSLTIHEFYWPKVRESPSEASALTSLRILLASCSDYRVRRFSQCGIFQASEANAWRTPSLQSLHFSYSAVIQCPTSQSGCCCSSTLSISLADVHCFMSACILFDGPRLKSLTLSGVDPIDYNYEAFDLLSQSADAFQVCQDPANTEDAFDICGTSS